jgi:hypothetical protein
MLTRREFLRLGFYTLLVFLSGFPAGRAFKRKNPLGEYRGFKPFLKFYPPTAAVSSHGTYKRFLKYGASGDRFL